MADTRDTIRDTARDTGNAMNRAVTESPDTMTVVALVVGAAAILLFVLYAFGAFSSPMTARAVTDTNAPYSDTTTPSNTPAPESQPTPSN